MAKKSKVNKKEAGPVFNIKGGVHAQRDTLFGNQYNFGGQTQQNYIAPQTTGEFVAELKKLQVEIAALKQQPELSPPVLRAIDAVEVQIIDAAEEAQQPVPMGQTILATLSEARTTLDTISGSLESAARLGMVVGTLGNIALRLFGG